MQAAVLRASRSPLGSIGIMPFLCQLRGFDKSACPYPADLTPFVTLKADLSMCHREHCLSELKLWGWLVFHAR